MRPTLRLATLLIVLCASSTTLFAQAIPDNAKFEVGVYLDFEQVRNPQISPDGSQVIYTRRHVDKVEDEWESELWIMHADGSRNRYLTTGGSVSWSSDGTRIAYMTQGDPDGSQIVVRWMDAEGATSQITRLEESPSNVRWAPDGKSLAFSMLVPDKETWSIDMPGAPEGANWTAPPRMITRTHYRSDRAGFTEDGYTHIFTVPADGGTPRQLTAGDWNVGGGISWTPDGNTIVFGGLMEEEPEEDGYRQSYIYAVDVNSRETRQLVMEKGQWGSPLVSPDGRHVAFTGFPFTLQTYKSSELYAIGLDGRNMVSVR